MTTAGTPQQRQQEQQRDRQAHAKDEERRAQQAQQEQQRWDEDADRKRQKYDDEPHWPDAPIEEIPAEEREALLKQAGPPGEMARVAWARYQEEQRDDRGDEPAAVMKEQTRLQEMGAPVGENYGPVHDQGDVVRAEQHSAVRQAMSPEQAVKTPIGQEHVPGQADQGSGQNETGSAQDRADAEKKAKKLNLEIRDYGAAGEWRVYDPATGRQVARSRLDESPTSGMK
jgi:hypothetical protein